MWRRNFILSVLGSSIGAGAISPLLAATNNPQATLSEIQNNWRELLAPGAKIAENNSPLGRDPKSWQNELPKDSYEVLFEEDTERAFTSPLNDEKRAGIYVCRACDLPLFSSAMKYDSGTGWPSFFTAIPNNLGTKTDFKLIWPRTEYHCVRCGGHQGHVFEDGPAPTGQRWCNNGVALRFIPFEK